MSAAREFPVAPDSVYVWRGFRSASTAQADFVKFLGTVFVPACALLQPSVGLRAYLPALVTPEGKPAAIPDQTALMFWAQPGAHDAATRALAVRVYQNLHGDAYDMQRSKLPEVPVPLTPQTTALVPEQPYYLLPQPSDWMRGRVHHLVAAFPPDRPAPEFLGAVRAWAAGFQAQPAAGVDGLLLCAGQGYVVAWAHAAPSSPSPATALDGLAALAPTWMRQNARRLRLSAGLWDDWPGLDLATNQCLNIQLRRPPSGQASPRPRRAA